MLMLQHDKLVPKPSLNLDKTTCTSLSLLPPSRLLWPLSLQRLLSYWLSPVKNKGFHTQCGAVCGQQTSHCLLNHLYYTVSPCFKTIVA